MSINCCHTRDHSGVILFFGERLLVNYDGCELKLSGKGSQPKGNYSGTAFLTSHRVLFLPKKGDKQLLSLSMPFVYMKEVDIKQPTFGANRIEGFVLAESNAWEGRLPFSLTFKHGGAIEFGKALLELGTRASKLRNSYVPPPPPPMTEYYSCPPPAYAPPYGDPYYSFMTQHPAFGPPVPDSLYQSNSLPPYPGAVPPTYTPEWPAGANSQPPAYPLPSGAYPPQPGTYPSQPTGAYGGPPMGAPYPANGPPASAPYPPTGPPPPYAENGVSEGYYFQQYPHTVYAPPAATAPAPSAPPMPEETKKNI
uniref:GRAM domain-containing protein n=1 Tax=Schistocephalus solidus TaxID=70667 RepID=A0A0X3PUK1_SCHSO